jgi:hypothetical protein
MLFGLSVVAVGVVAALFWTLYRRAGASGLQALSDKRRATSRIVSGGELVDGNRHLQVSLALTDTDLFYENADLQASLELSWIQEVEYDSSLVTGQPVRHGQVLRVRGFSQVFEFVLPDDVVPRWQAVLPPRGRAESPAEAQVPAAVGVTA